MVLRRLPCKLCKVWENTSKLLLRLVWHLIEYFKSYLFRRQFRRQFSTVFHVVLQAPSNGIMATALWILWSFSEYFKSYYWDQCEICLSISIYILFRRQFRRQFSTVFLCNFAGTIDWNYANCPVNLAEFDWVLQKLLMQSTEPTLWQRRRSVFRWYLSQFSTVLHVILHTPFAAIAATALKIWWGLIEYFKS